LLEIGFISNLNERETRGLQIGGIANFTGANAYAGLQFKEIDKKKREGFEANLSGAQFSGLTNVVLYNVFGWQTTGGANVVKGALQGLQIAGISNTVYKYSFGIQLAGLWNISAESMDGVQVASLANYTKGGLYGAQIGALNQAGFIEGVNSYENDDPSGIQIGLVNKAGKMNGFQIGLVNVGKQMQGTQIGLVNIYGRGKMGETRDGTAVGLFNIGDVGYAAFYASELFITNIELSTGTMKNGRVKSDAKNVYVHNALIYANDAKFLSKDSIKQARWAFGYGLKKTYYNRSLTPGMGEFRFYSFGVDFMHINHEHKKLTKNLSLLVRPKISAGTKLHPKIRSLYVFAAVSYNLYWTDREHTLSTSFLESTSQLGGEQLEMWPGFSAGIQIH
jgi:hypothetical protein